MNKNYYISVCKLYNPKLRHETELKASQTSSDVNGFVGTVVRVGRNWTVNTKSLHIRNAAIVIK